VRTFNSGTCTMEIALRIAGIGPGDEVITTPISWVATANVIIEVGATPVFADIDPVTRNIDLDKVEAAITPRTKAIIPVYLSGLPVDMDRLYAIAAKHNLRVVEDAGLRLGMERQAHRRVWRFRLVQLPGQQEHHHRRRRRAGAEHAEEARLAEKYRLQGVTRSGVDGIDVDVLGGKYNMSDIMPPSAWASSPISMPSPRIAGTGAPLLRVFGADFEAQSAPSCRCRLSIAAMFHLLPDHPRRPWKMGRSRLHPPFMRSSIGTRFKEGMFPVPNARPAHRLLPMFTMYR
jgi:hypothetical protein